MRLIRFNTEKSANPDFGVMINGHAVSFEALQARAGTSHPNLTNSHAYLASLPQSEQAAREMLEWGSQHFQELSEDECHRLDVVNLKTPIEVTALFDLGLTPRHLQNSAETVAKYELNDPKILPLLEMIGPFLADRPIPPAGQPEPLLYYKCNMNSICGDNETIPWPRYTSRLDIEPELAVVYGNSKQPIAGFCIFNDVSARDVQTPEFIGGFCRSKDMAKGNQLGPYLVTVDEIGDPYQLDVTVTVDGKIKYQGSTTEISHTAEDIFAYLETIAPLQPGNTMGFGTIPDCTGLDHDDFIDPGARIEIMFEKLGTLRCNFSEPKETLFPSRWPLREALKKYHVEKTD